MRKIIIMITLILTYLTPIKAEYQPAIITEWSEDGVALDMYGEPITETWAWDDQNLDYPFVYLDENGKEIFRSNTIDHTFNNAQANITLKAKTPEGYGDNLSVTLISEYNETYELNLNSDNNYSENVEVWLGEYEVVCTNKIDGYTLKYNSHYVINGNKTINLTYVKEELSESEQYVYKDGYYMKGGNGKIEGTIPITNNSLEEEDRQTTENKGDIIWSSLLISGLLLVLLSILSNRQNDKTD